MPDTDILSPEDIAELRAYVAELPEAEQRAVLADTFKLVTTNSSIWFNGIEPLWFDEFCVELDGCPLFPRQKRIMRKCGLLDPKSWVSKTRLLSQIILVHGKGAGKDMLSAKVLAYLAYVCQHVAPRGDGWETRAQFFGQAPDAQLSIVNVAPSQDHARRVFFRYLSGYLSKPIFKKYKPTILTDTISFYTEEAMANQITTAGKQRAQPWLVLYSLHSKSSGFDGMNIIGWVMDEADDFHDSADKSNAEAVYAVLCASCATRMQQRWIGLVISYPRVEAGFMERMYASAIKAMAEMGEKCPMYADKAATWEVNTKTSRDDPAIELAYQQDPTRAAAMYECVGEGTLVMDECGLVPIEDAPNRIYKGDRHTINILTKHGYEITVTKDHRLLMPNGNWIMAGDLVPGGTIAINQEPMDFGSHTVDLRIAELCGLLIGDGCITCGTNKWGNPTPSITWCYDPQDEDLADHHMAILKDLGHVPYKRLVGRAIQVRIRTQAAMALFAGLLGEHALSKAHNKRVPKWVFSSKKEVVAAFLSGLMEADGSINRRGIVDFGSASRGLAQDVQRLLLMFGITSNTNWHKSINNAWGGISREFWTVSLSQLRALRYCKEIGFLSNRKKGARPPENTGSRAWHRTTSSTPLYADTVLEITDGGIRPVYDLLDRPGQRFVANGFIAHNCIAMPTENAFFEFPERIALAVDYDRHPIAHVEYVNTDQDLANGGKVHYVEVKVSNIVRVPGYTYFLGADSGRKGDSYTICVGHVDDQNDAFRWLCPDCGRSPTLRQAGRYEVQPMRATQAVTSDGGITCGACWDVAPLKSGGTSGMRLVDVAGWWAAGDTSESLIVDEHGNKLNIGTVYEDLLIRIKPVRATRPGEVNRVVSFLAVQQVCIDLMNALGVEQARFDQWQTIQLRESMIQCNCGDVDEISFSNPEQYRRARLTKTLLYGNMLSLLPNDVRDTEWRRLQLINGMKIDHPEGGSKDAWDAEAIVFWLASVYRDSRVSILFP